MVLAIIPFGLVGAFYGHVAWEVPLSMFSVVGLIGMTGIIINDSIVMVTTVDEFSRNRGLKEAIIEGACNRLRAVMLTTLTTVLGLTPLLYEQSQQAQFLRPTVITLVYGLGFGMLLVLILVPALMAMQADLATQFRALRRTMALRRAGRPISLAVLAASLPVAGLFAATLGAVIVSGEMPQWLQTFAPMAGSSPLSSALILFVAGSMLLILLIYLISIAVIGLMGRTRVTRSA